MLFGIFLARRELWTLADSSQDTGRGAISPETKPGLHVISFEIRERGAIGFDWVTVSKGGVPWLISWPRKKLIKQQLPLTGSTRWLHSNRPGLGIPV